jgi:GEVED domain/Secretion system C-terminal sorting domain
MKKLIQNNLFIIFILLVSFSIQQNASAQCPVTTNPANQCTTGGGDQINAFSLNSIVSPSSSGCSGSGPAGYGSFSSPVWDLTQGQTYNWTAFMAGPSNSYAENFAIWIDLNNNNIYEATEMLYHSTVALHGNISGTITIPLTATIANNVHMRIRNAFTPYVFNGNDACVSYVGSYGETEDYKVNIHGLNCTGTPVAGTISPAGPINLCSGSNTTLTLSGYTNASGISIDWQQSTNGGSTYISTGNTSNTYTITPTSNVLVMAVVTCSNSSLSANSNAVTINSIAPSGTPTINISGNNTFCQGNTGTFTAVTNVTSPTYQWKVNGINVGTNSNTYIYTPNPGDILTCIVTTPTGSCYTTNNATSNSIIMTVTPTTAPYVGIAGPNNSCLGVLYNYTATTNITGGTYQWQVNGVNTGTNSSLFAYAPAQSDNMTCMVTAPVGGCYSPNSATSNTLVITGIPSITPSDSIYSLSSTDTVCSSLPVIYATNTNILGGSYQWQVNGANVGYNSPAYNYTPTNGDIIKCLVYTPPTGCFTSSMGTSNSRTITVINSLLPTVIISGNNPVCQNTPVIYTATTNIVNGIYQWSVNNNPVGTNSNTFTYLPIDSDYITCTVTEPVYPPTGPCYTQTAATNSPFVAVVQEPAIPYIDIHAPVQSPIGSTVTVTGTVTNAGSSYNIQWKNHNTTFATTSAPVVSYTKQAGTDSITAIVTPAVAGCFGSASSNYQLVNVGTTTVNNVNSTSGISIYPNPFNDHINISGLNINDRVCIYDLMGRKVTQVWTAETLLTEQTFNISHLPSAGYILQIWNESGETRETVTLFKK